ncbi:hypothetical protein OH76DRAFT_1418621 [Lentinus brumalis]|uniref:Uncharacterized protein n=1 Tax=Lentinus brumalis TaxID=2498619 RepID=A0A371D994_9APHY|nr:hypothetical protein OH76DRAFT_1418621 [Polyporus brumalis]
MPPKTQDEIAALRLQEAEAQVALARANMEKLEAKLVATEATLRRTEAAERETEKARQTKKRTPTKPRSAGTAGREDREEKAAIVPCMPCCKAKAICWYFTSGRSATCMGARRRRRSVRKQKIQDMVDSDLKEIEPPTPKKKQTEEAPKVGPSKGKERAHLEPEPEPEVEKAQPKKIAGSAGGVRVPERDPEALAGHGIPPGGDVGTPGGVVEVKCGGGSTPDGNPEAG